MSTWPFVERRKADRRQQDRRRQAPQADRPAGYAAHECTDREQQIIALLLQGMTNKEIAQTLGIAEDTVKKHLQHAYKKLGVRRRALLIADHRVRDKSLPQSPVRGIARPRDRFV
jgi:DNA-binding CsgD family transcriptional regulator